MRPCFILYTILTATTGNVLAGDLYRWVDQSGNVHYGDAPVAEAVQIEQIKFTDSPIADAALPLETRRAKEAFPVSLYVADNCIEVCQWARDLLNNRGIPFTEKNLLSQEDIDSFRKMSGDEKVPVLVVGKNWLKGFVQEQWNDELDIAGYPKTAPYGYRPSVPLPETNKPPSQTAPAISSEPTSGLEAPSNNE